jgi:hypothetical protein
LEIALFRLANAAKDESEEQRDGAIGGPTFCWVKEDKGAAVSF